MSDSEKFGVDIDGEWDELVEKGEEIKERLEEEGKEEEAEKWENWRPKEDETLEKEMTEKSVEKSTIGDKDPDHNKSKAQKKWKDTKKDASRSKKELSSLVTNFYATIKSKVIEKIKRLEKFVFKNITARYNPKYYEDETFNSSIEKKNKFLNEKEEYKMNVNFEDDEANKKIDEKVLDEDG